MCAASNTDALNLHSQPRISICRVDTRVVLHHAGITLWRCEYFDLIIEKLDALVTFSSQIAVRSGRIRFLRYIHKTKQSCRDVHPFRDRNFLSAIITIPRYFRTSGIETSQFTFKETLTSALYTGATLTILPGKHTAVQVESHAAADQLDVRVTKIYIRTHCQAIGNLRCKHTTATPIHLLRDGGSYPVLDNV
jgi:hypothetical protein